MIIDKIFGKLKFSSRHTLSKRLELQICHKLSDKNSSIIKLKHQEISLKYIYMKMNYSKNYITSFAK